MPLMIRRFLPPVTVSAEAAEDASCTLESTPCAAVVPQVERVEQAMQSLCDKPFSLLDIAIYALPVVPGLVITDRGVVDGISQTFVQYIKPCEAKSNG